MEDAMTSKRLGPVVGAAILSALCVLLSTPAAAQVGTLRGKVVDEAGKPVPDAEVVFQTKNDPKFRAATKTNAKGEFIQAGLTSAKAVWSVSATKDGVTTGISGIDVPYKAVADVPDLVLKSKPPAAEALKLPGGNAGAEAEKLRAELGKIFEEANAALATNSYDAAIAKYNEVIAKLPTCDICYLRVADVSLRKGDLAGAETAYKKAVELDPKSVDAYEGLAGIYNTQKKFAEAGEATKKASELRGAVGGGGADATSLFNAGVIFWNQSKVDEAADQFQKAIKADPSMADAYYYYGMALINQGKVPEAKTQLQQYLKLAPTGQHAETAKSILGSI
jgi:cytochrome c-type biogenesis protein CcmH/NrfG